jgi:aspartate/methionine/tyrosine aminotransferase
MAQWGCVAAFDADLSDIIRGYVRRRDMVVRALGDLTELTTPTGAFYAFVKVPSSLGLTGTQFVEKAIERGLLIIPGGVFSRRDTHFRLSFAAPEEKLTEGLKIIAELMRG